MKLFSIKLSKKQKITISIISVILTALVVAGIYLMSMVKPPEMIERPTVIEYFADGYKIKDITRNTSKTGDVYTILLVGRDKVGLNTDTIMVVSFDTINYTVNAVSIPRDTMSANVSRTTKKINAAYSIGGKANPTQLKKEVEQLLGFSIDRYAVINLEVFVNIIDLIGGVEVDVPRKMYYHDPDQNLIIDLKAGLQRLDGNDAMGFVRYRSGYATGDLGRIDAQKIFIEALAKEVLRPSIITKVPSIVEEVFANIDTDFSMGEIVWLATEALHVDLEEGINIFMLPGYSQTVGLSYYFAYENQWLEMLNEYLNPTHSEIIASDLRLAKPSDGGTITNTTTKEEVLEEEELFEEEFSEDDDVLEDETGDDTSSDNTSNDNTSSDDTSNDNSSEDNSTNNDTSNDDTTDNTEDTPLLDDENTSTESENESEEEVPSTDEVTPEVETPEVSQPSDTPSSSETTQSETPTPEVETPQVNTDSEVSDPEA